MEKIDCVYLWVDGDDPSFQERWKEAGGGGSESESIVCQHFRDNGELRYSLRSLERHVPWVNKIHIVHQDGLPTWLDTSNERLQTVRHEQLFPEPSVLPTFNSCAIELNLHRIPGLSRRFLYFNDDLFLGREVTPEAYLPAGGRQRFYLEPNPIARSTWGRPVHDKAYAHTLKLVRHVLGRRCYLQSFEALAAPKTGWRRTLPSRCLLPAHVPQLYDRDRLFELEALLPEAYRATRAHRFRSHQDLVLRILYVFSLMKDGKVDPFLLHWNSAGYLFIGLKPELAPLKAAFNRMKRLEPSFICVNDDLGDVPKDHPALTLWRKVMQERYPVASSFEIKDPHTPLHGR